MIVAGRPLCARCKRPVDGAVLCSPCGEAFTRTVADLQALLPELAVTVTKQDVVGQPARHAKDPLEEMIEAAGRVAGDARSLIANPMPVNLEAAALFAEVRALLIGAVTRIARIHELPLDFPPAIAGPHHAWCMHPSCVAIAEAGRWGDRLCAWLIRHAETIRQYEAVAALIRDLERVRRWVETAIDRRDPDVYVGPCDAPDVEVSLDGDVVRLATEEVVDEKTGELVTVVSDRICGVDLYANLGDLEVECPACRYTYQVADRKAWLLEAVRDVWARPALIASALTTHGMELNAARLDQWISRDKKRHKRCLEDDGCGCILQVGIDSDDVDADGRPVGKPLYRIGDVLDRLEALRVSAAERSLEVSK
jgi:hypothetical protein